jgi:hypothetical protein
LQKARDFIRVGHIPDPSAPCSIQESISEAYEHEDDDEDRIGRVRGHDNIGDEVASGTDDCDSALAELDVHEVIYHRGKAVACERREEYEGYDGVV